MELTRRDAAAALAALGAGGAAAAVADRVDAPRARDGPGGPPEAGDAGGSMSDERVGDALVAVAAAVYPSGLSGVDGFVRSFLDGRLDRPGHGPALRATVGRLDDLAVEWHGDRLAALSPATVDRLLREVGADAAEAAPDGTLAERVRYYVVNELLLALYASPTGGTLVGLENPQGHAGGADSYRRGPR